MMRYRLDLPVTFRWQDQQGRQRVGAGFTRDVSAVGMFVFTDVVPQPDELLHCEVKFPRLRDSGCVPVTVTARVVRVVSSADWRQQGFAVVGHMLQLCNELSPDEVMDAEAQERPAVPSKRLN